MLIVLGPLLVQNEELFLRIGFGLKSAFTMSAIAGYIYQFERCIKVIREVDSAVRTYQTTFFSDLNMVIHKMRMTQAVHLSIGLPSGLILLLLATEAIPSNVWITLLPPCIEALGALLYAIKFRGKKRPKEGPSDIIARSVSAMNHSGKIGLPAVADLVVSQVLKTVDRTEASVNMAEETS